MYGKLLSTLLLKKLAPALAIGVIYLVVIAIPQRRSLYQLQGEVEQSASELANLENKIAMELRNWKASQPVTVSEASMLSSSIEKEAAEIESATCSDSTCVQRFGQLIAVFQTHGVRCQSATQEKTDRHDEAACSRHHLSLVGTFPAMQASIDQIQSAAPHVAITAIEMKQTLELNDCHWEVTLEIAEKRR